MIIWLQQVGMQILIWLLAAIDSVFAVFSAAAGITEVNAGGEQQTLGTYFMGLSGVQRAFWIVIIASVVVCGICTVAAIIKNTINAKGGESKSHAKTIGQSLSTVFITLFMGAFLFAGVACADKLLYAVNREINGGEQQLMSHQIIEVSLSETYIYDRDNIQGFNKYDDDDECTYMSYLYEYDSDGEDTSIPMLGYFQPAPPKTFPDKPDCIVFINPTTGAPYISWEEIYNEVKDDDGNVTYEIKSTGLLKPRRLLSGWIDESAGASVLDDNILRESYKTILGTHTGSIVPSGWKYDGKIYPDSFNFLVAFLCAVILLFALVTSIFGLVKRLYDIVLLFIVLPGITATIPLDDGAKFKLWRETVISKVFLAFGSVFAVNVFFIVAPSLWGVTIAGATSFVNSLLRVVLICGGALTISGGQLLFARLLGTSAEESREMGQSARTLMGGAMTGLGLAKAAGRGLFGAKNANGQRVGGLLKGGAGILGAVGGGLANALGSAVGGQAYRGSKFAKGVSATQKALKGFGQSAGWVGHDRSTGGNTLGSAVAGGVGKLGSKFAGSGGAQRTGLDRGLLGGAQKLGQTVGSKVNMAYGTRLDKESQATKRASDIAAAFDISPYAVRHVKDKKK